MCVRLIFITVALSSSAVLAAPPADSLEYALTDTKLKIGLGVELKECLTSGPVVEPSLTVVAAPSPSTHRHRVSGAGLASFFQKRDVSIALNENGTLKSIGGSASDKTAAIITNLLKTAVSLIIPIIPSAGLSETGNLACTDEAEAALADSKLLKSKIQALRAELLKAQDPARIKQLNEALEILAAQRASAVAKLKIAAETEVVPPSNPGEMVVVSWKNSDFKKLFKNMPAEFANGFNLALRFDATSDQAAFAQANSNASAPKPPYLLLREPVDAKVSAHGTGHGHYWTAAALANLEPAKVAIGQWGGLSYYPLRAGFGRNRSLKLEFNALGQKTAMALNSEATGEVISASTIGAAESLASLYKASTEMARQQLRINQLKAEQELHKLEACQEKLDAGLTC